MTTLFNINLELINTMNITNKLISFAAGVAISLFALSAKADGDYAYANTFDTAVTNNVVPKGGSQTNFNKNPFQLQARTGASSLLGIEIGQVINGPASNAPSLGTSNVTYTFRSSMNKVTWKTNPPELPPITLPLNSTNYVFTNAFVDMKQWRWVGLVSVTNSALTNAFVDVHFGQHR